MSEYISRPTAPCESPKLHKGAYRITTRDAYAQIRNLFESAHMRHEPAARLEPDLDPLIFRFVSLHDERGQKEDIEYIKSVIFTNHHFTRIQKTSGTRSTCNGLSTFSQKSLT